MFSSVAKVSSVGRALVFHAELHYGTVFWGRLLYCLLQDCAGSWTEIRSLNNSTVFLIRRHDTDSMYGQVQNGQSALFIVVFMLKLKHHAVLSCQQVRKAIILKARCKIQGDSFTLQSLLVNISIYFFLVKRNFAKKG